MKSIPLGRFAALLPILVAGICTAIGVATSGWGHRTVPPVPFDKTPLLPPRPLVDGASPPPKTFITGTQTAKIFALPPPLSSSPARLGVDAPPKAGGAPLRGIADVDAPPKASGAPLRGIADVDAGTKDGR